jgi:hypothetical protein
VAVAEVPQSGEMTKGFGAKAKKAGKGTIGSTDKTEN